jgi:hypothetical protein
MKEKEKSAESGEQKKLAKTVLAETHEDKCNAGGGTSVEWTTRPSPILLEWAPEQFTSS